MSELAKKNRDEKISKTEIPNIDCSCIDSRTRKMLSYLIEKELKFLDKFPTAWVDGQEYNLLVLKEQIEKCEFKRKTKTQDDEKRPLTDYQIFIQTHTKSTEQGGKGLSFEEATELWRKTKENESK